MNVRDPIRLPTPVLAAVAAVCLSSPAPADLVSEPAPAPPAAALPRDVLYAALHGAPESVDPEALVATPGRFVGRAVRTRGRLAAVDAGASRFDLAIGRTRVPLRLEPEARALVAARASSWAGAPIVVEGFFYRETAADPATAPYALRAWMVSPPSEAVSPPAPPSGAVPLVSLQDLVYGAGRYDGRLIRVRGSYRGSNRHADLPERTRKSRADWVVKDGYFAAWVAGREARGGTWDLTRRESADQGAVVELVGTPTTADGVVRIQARGVELSTEFAAGALAQPRDAGLQAVSPRVSFAWPIAGEALGPPGHMVLQFSKPLDPQSLESRVRVRYLGGEATAPAVSHEYRQRYRALVVTPATPPPPGTDVVVELLEGIIDIDGRALTPRSAAGEPDLATAGERVVDAIRFRSRP